MIFSSVLILGYLFSYKISDYLADFKILKEKSRIDIVFLFLFFIILLIPSMHINEKSKSIYENRTLAKWYPLIRKSGELNYYFGKDFNKWFSDRFCLRNEMITLYSSFQLLFKNNLNGAYLDKKTRNVYARFEYDFADIGAIAPSVSALMQFKKWCEDNGIKLYVLVTPAKYEVYKTDSNPLYDPSVHEAFLKYIDRVNKNSKLEILYPYEEMLQAKKDNFMYFKTEHHWTDDGAYVGYKTLMKEIKKDYPNLKVLGDDDFEYYYSKKVRGDFSREFTYGQISNRLGTFRQPLHKVKYRYFKHKDYGNLKVTVREIPYNRERIFYYPKGANLRTILLGNSQCENLGEFVPFTFKNTLRRRTNYVQKIPPEEYYYIIKWNKKAILDFKPDIIIFCVQYANFPALKDIFKE